MIIVTLGHADVWPALAHQVTMGGTRLKLRPSAGCWKTIYDAVIETYHPTLAVQDDILFLSKDGIKSVKAQLEATRHNSPHLS